MQRLFWCAPQSCGQPGWPLTLCLICFWLQTCATTTARLSAEGGAVTVGACARGLTEGRPLWVGDNGDKNFAPLQERCFTRASRALICQQNCSEVTAANCWQWEQECNYQWEWDVKLVCYFKWADGRSWCNSKILQFHINVNLKQNPPKRFKYDDDNGALPATV